MVFAQQKYLPLNHYLATLSREQPSVVLTFAELEHLLGDTLPRTAWLRRYWTTGGVARHNWQRAGFTASLDRLGQRVIFTRREASSRPPPLG